MSENQENKHLSPEQEGLIDVEKDPFAYNRDFDPANPVHFETWLKMRPTHISEEEWPLQLAKLKLMLESTSDEYARQMIMLGWKSENRLLPRQ